MSAHAGAISIQSSHGGIAAWRRVAVAAVMIAAAAGSGAIIGRATAPSAAVPAVAPHVQTGTITSTRPLSDATFVIGGVASHAGAPAALRTDTPAGVHGRQVAP